MNRLFAALSFCLLLAGFTACTHKNSVLPTAADPTLTTNTPAAGNWHVNQYTNRGVDETPDFDGYTFSFNSDGTFTALRNSLSVTGTWTRSTDDGLQKLTLTISSATDAHLAELNEDWAISLMTDSNINLADDKGNHELRFQQ